MSISNLNGISNASTAYLAAQTAATDNSESAASNVNADLTPDAAQAAANGPVSLSDSGRALLAQEQQAADQNQNAGAAGAADTVNNSTTGDTGDADDVSQASPQIAAISYVSSNVVLKQSGTSDSGAVVQQTLPASAAEVALLVPILGALTSLAATDMGINATGATIGFTSVSYDTSSTSSTSVEQQGQQVGVQASQSSDDVLSGEGYIMTAGGQLYGFDVSLDADQSRLLSMAQNTGNNTQPTSLLGLAADSNMLPSQAQAASGQTTAADGEINAVVVQNANVAKQTTATTAAAIAQSTQSNPFPASVPTATAHVVENNGTNAGGDAASAIQVKGDLFDPLNVNAIMQQAKNMLSLLESVHNIEQEQGAATNGSSGDNPGSASQSLPPGAAVAINTSPTLDSLSVYYNATVSVLASN